MGVRRGIAVMALVWQGAWMLTDPGLRTEVTKLGAGGLFYGALAVWAAISISIAVKAPRSLVYFLGRIDVALLVLCATFLLVVEVNEKSSAGLSMTLLAVGVTGLLLPARASLPISATLILTEVVLLFVHGFARQGNDSWLTILSPVYASAVAVAVIAGRFYSLAAAKRSDEVTEDLVALEARTRGIRAVEGELLARERLLHETALNTLTAIARGGNLNRESVERRCEESALAVESMTQASPPPSTLDTRIELSSAILVARYAVSRVDVSAVEATALDDVPYDVASSIIGAMREGLLNAARHSGATSLVASLHRNEIGIHASVIDDGTGFDVSERQRGFGITAAIEDSLELVGGSGRVTSSPGNGTCIELSWAPPDQKLELPSGANGVAVPILTGFLTFAGISLVATVTSADRPGLDVLAYVVALGVATLALPLGRVSALPAWRVLAVCATVPLPYLLQQAAFDGPASSSWADWSAEAMVGILLTIACTGPWWTWIPALIVWLGTMGDPLGELLQPGTAVIVGGALFARSVRRSHRSHVAAIEKRVSEEASASAAAEAIRRIQHRYSRLSASGAATLLREIADGTLDPANAYVQDRCLDEERFLRSLMRLDPDRTLDDLASLMLLQARRRGVPLEIDLAADVELNASQLEPMRVACLAAVDIAVVGEPLRLSARREGGVVMVRLVGALDGVLPEANGVIVERDVQGATLVEVGLD